MDLEQRVQAELGTDGALARRALGAVMSAVRMTMPSAQFDQVAENLPRVRDWMANAPIGGGRTAEMVGIIGPDTLERQLRDMDLDQHQVAALYAVVGAELRQAAPEAAAAAEDKLPQLRA